MSQTNVLCQYNKLYLRIYRADYSVRQSYAYTFFFFLSPYIPYNRHKSAFVRHAIRDSNSPVSNLQPQHPQNLNKHALGHLQGRPFFLIEAFIP